MHKLSGVMRSYAWGSRTAISYLRGDKQPSVYPEAELWFGAHRLGAAKITGANLTLLDIIDANSLGELGGKIAEHYQGSLPFMVKILAANEPLSLQAHPSKQQAFEGFRRENSAGIALDAVERNYKDPHHKPEIIIALGDFELLVGFANPQSIIALLSLLAKYFSSDDIRWIYDCIELIVGQPDAQGLRAAFTTFLTLPSATIGKINSSLVNAATQYLSRGKTEFSGHIKAILTLAEIYPNDFGVIAATMMNFVHLDYGDAIFVPSGNLHSYISGLGLEVLGNSDNVLRGGLTPKHVDVPELLRILDFSSYTVDELICHSRQVSHGVFLYTPNVEEFGVYRYCLDSSLSAVDIPVPGPCILVNIHGEIAASDGNVRVRINPTEGLWISANDYGVRIENLSENAEFFLICPEVF